MGQEPETPNEEPETQEVSAQAPEAEPEAPKTFDEGYVKKLRAEAAESRTKARELQDRLQKIEDAEKTELERATSRAEEAEKARDEAVSRANATLIRAAVVAEAAKQGAVDPDVVVALLESDAVAITEDGEVEGVQQAVTGLLEAKPFLLGDQGKPPAGPSGGGLRETPSEPTAAELRELAKTNPAEFNRKFEAGEIPASALGGN